MLEGFADWQIVDATDVIAADDQGLAGADAILLCGWAHAGLGYLSDERLGRVPSLAFLGTTAHFRQAEFIDLEAASRRSIVICDTAPVNALWVAEYELALCLSGLRRIPFEHHVVGTGGWVDWGELEEEPDLLTGRSVGLVSFGAIHRRLAALLRPFEVEGKVFDPYVPAEEVVAAGLTKVHDLALLASTSDILFVATPPTSETMGLIDAEVFAALPDGALVVLVSRMGVVDQDALVPELISGRISFATDVYAPEPPSVDHPLRTLPNVIHTPHRAGGTLAAQRAGFREQCLEARRFFAGEPLRYPLRLDQVAINARVSSVRRSR